MYIYFFTILYIFLFILFENIFDNKTYCKGFLLIKLSFRMFPVMKTTTKKTLPPFFTGREYLRKPLFL